MDSDPHPDGSSEAVTDDVAAADGTRLRLRGRVPPGGAATAVLFVHGATYPGGPVFDLAGASWLAACARPGRAGYAVDLRGYGDSERPPDLDAPPDENPPVVRADVAAGDVAAAIEHVRDARGHERVHLVGYSWGTMICGRLLATREHDPDVASLTQFAPVHSFPDGLALAADDRAYRTVTEREVRERWDAHFATGGGTGEGEGEGTAGSALDPDSDSDPDRYRDPDLVDAFWAALADTGQAVEREGEGDGATVVRAPNGTLADMSAAAAGDPPYDPAAVDRPALVVRGSLDGTATRADALGVYDALDAREDRKEYAEVAGGSHFLPVERRREALYDVVAGFHARCE